MIPFLSPDLKEPKGLYETLDTAIYPVNPISEVVLTIKNGASKDTNSGYTNTLSKETTDPPKLPIVSPYLLGEGGNGDINDGIFTDMAYNEAEPNDNTKFYTGDDP